MSEVEQYWEAIRKKWPHPCTKLSPATLNGAEYVVAVHQHLASNLKQPQKELT